MKLYIGNKNYSSWSLRPWLALKHFEIAFAEEVIFLDKSDTTANILKVSPSGRVPALVDGAVVMWDSLAICEYLADRHPDRKLWPWHAGDRALARSISSEMHSGFAALRTACPMKVRDTFKNFHVPRQAQTDLSRIDEIWRTMLTRSNGPYLFGDFSIADAMFAPIAFRVKSYDLKMSAQAMRYVALMLDHPAMKQWQREAQNEDQVMERYL